MPGEGRRGPAQERAGGASRPPLSCLWLAPGLAPLCPAEPARSESGCWQGLGLGCGDNVLALPPQAQWGGGVPAGGCDRGGRHRLQAQEQGGAIVNVTPTVPGEAPPLPGAEAGDLGAPGREQGGETGHSRGVASSPSRPGGDPFTLQSQRHLQERQVPPRPGHSAEGRVAPNTVYSPPPPPVPQTAPTPTRPPACVVSGRGSP